MNERIQDLAKRSGAEWDNKYHWYVGNETMKNFAELIVRECALLIHKKVGPKTALDLLQHFGVEE